MKYEKSCYYLIYILVYRDPVFKITKTLEFVQVRSFVVVLSSVTFQFVDVAVTLNSLPVVQIHWTGQAHGWPFAHQSVARSSGL